MSTIETNRIKWATLQDLREEEHRALFRRLEQYQARFLAAHKAIGIESYRWPHQPLYEWSRRAEYVFAAKELHKRQRCRILDAGSGVTFFPFYLAAALGHDVVCLDKETEYGIRIEQVFRLLNANSQVKFSVGDLSERLPFPDNSFHAVLCISVVEHLLPEHRLVALQELWRLVKPGGQLILTFDVSVTGEEEGIPLLDVDNFLQNLEKVVGKVPQLPRHLPPDLLTPQNPGYGLLPVKTGNEGPLIHSELERRLFALLKRPTVMLRPIACLMFCGEKADST